ncbi:MAG: hypothetical protein Q7T33_12385 [Dehalococcoidia bacterium]|nr:hypothetical protein [Dehalococcoidia bacterium]
MTEEERADWLARAVDDLLQGSSHPQPPDGLDREELEALMRVARNRLGAGRAAAHAGLHLEGAVWRQVLDRLQARQHRMDAAAARHRPAADAGSFAAAAEPADEDQEARGLRDILRLRKQMSEQMLSQAAAHQDNVWQLVQSRIQSGRPESAAPPPIRPAPALGGAGDAELEALLQHAHRQPPAAAAATAGAREGFWTRVRRTINPGRSGTEEGGAAGRTPWPGLATAAAGVVLLVAAVGPIPATGLAGHPAVRFADSIGRFVGLTETGSGPGAAGEGALVQGEEMSATSASALIGLPLQAPDSLPGGFTLNASRFYPQALTARQGGVFLLGYGGADGSTLSVYQEAAGGDDLAAFPGAATAVVLADGTPATYFEGAWAAADGRVFWSDQGSRNLVFDRAGLRTIIRLSGDGGDAAALAAIGSAMFAPAQ